MRSTVAVLVLLAGCGRYGFSSGGVIEVDHSSIDFTMLDCGASSTMTITLRNSGDLAVAYSVTSDVPGVDVSPTSGTIDPAASVVVTVTARADVDGLPGMPISGELLISTDDPTLGVTTIPLTMTTSGGVLTTNLTTLDFGQVTTSTVHTRSAIVENTGNAAISLTAGPFTDPAFMVVSAPTFSLDPGATHSIDVQFDPMSSQAYAFQLPLHASGALCQPMPVITAVGAGTLSTVLLDHTTLDFGSISCGSSSGGMTLNVTNANGTSYPFTATVTAGASSFTAAPVSGTVVASATTSITVTHAAVVSPSTPGPVTGNLHFVVTGPPNGTTDVPLQYQITGSSLSSTSTSIDFGQVSQTTSRTVMISNSGNEVADVQVNHSGSSRFSAPNSFQIAPGASKNFTITFSSTSTTTSTADFSISAGNECSTRFSIQASGRGTWSGGGD